MIFLSMLPNPFRKKSSLKSRLRKACDLINASDFVYWGLYNEEISKPQLYTPPPNWDERGKAQFEMLLELGLDPQHDFLDYGCAYLATARNVITYLEPKRYVGVDVSMAPIFRGVRKLSAEGISRSTYHLAQIKSPGLLELEGFLFDVIFAFSSMQYINNDDFPQVLSRLDQLLRPGGCMILNYSHDYSKELRRKKMFFHPYEKYRKYLPSDRYTAEREPLPPDKWPIARNFGLFRKQS